VKHNPKITAIIIGMFLLTQFIGLYVVDYYSPVRVVNGEIQNVTSPGLPYGMESPEVTSNSEYLFLFPFIIIAFIIAILVMFLLSKFKAEVILRIWFFLVVTIALGISLNTVFSPLQYASIISLIVALPLAFIKIFKQNFLIHNLTELLIYPGIAAVFVPILNLYTIIALLIVISIYDMWAVWHSGFMQKMAKYQIDQLKIFSGFFVPYASKKTKEKIKNLKMKLSKNELSKKKFRVNVAILGGGDVIFPIITAGVVLKTLGIYPALFVVAGATLGLGYLLFRSEKKKFYPAMPFITSGIFLGMIISRIIF
jgi:presenilin-like A22 family membrane protease